jgi:GNAT superfamily N-acetyltransferase
MFIRRCTVQDTEAVERMPTGFENDYVKRIFPYIVNDDILYGAFEGKELLALCGYGVYGGRYAVLGRMRTALPARGKGIATRLTMFVREQVRREKELVWYGLTTQEDNLPARRVADRIGLKPQAKLFYAHVHEQGEERLASFRSSGEQEGEWEEVRSTREKSDLLASLPERENELSVFPYAGYYPLPYDKVLWDNEYLARCRCFRRGKRFFLTMPDDKGDAYLHIKYFWNDSFEQPGFWSTVMAEARRQRRKVWMDFTEEGYRRIPDPDCFDIQTPWLLYGTDRGGIL